MVVHANYLEELGEKHLPTKMYCNYLRRYWLLFKDIRLDVRKVVEIGVQSGKSVRMWAEFFSNATIHGLDIDESCKVHTHDRIKVTIADSTNPDDVRRFATDVGGDIDIVIDDGSHWYRDQIDSFRNLFPHLKHGGLYAIEDIGAGDSPDKYKTLHAIEELVDGINYYPRMGR